MSYYCSLCDYSTNDKRNFNRHEISLKHNKKSNILKQKIQINFQKTETKNDTETIFNHKDIEIYKCDNCTKKFETRSGIYKHKKKCINKVKGFNIIDDKDKIINDLKSQLEISEYKLKLEIAEKEKELYKNLEKEKTELLKEKTELLNNFMHSANKIINKEQDNNKVTTDALKSVSMSALKYANEKFKNTPALIPLNNFNLKDLDFDDEEDKKK